MNESDRLSGERRRAIAAGKDVSRPVRTRHFFSLPGLSPEGLRQQLLATVAEDVFVDEEVVGAGYWFVTAFVPMLLKDPEAANTIAGLARAARRSGASHDGWQVTLTVSEEQHVKVTTQPRA